MLQGKFDYVEVTYYNRTFAGYLIDVSNGIGTLVSHASNTAFTLDRAEVRVLFPGKTSFPINREIDQKTCYFPVTPTY